MSLKIPFGILYLSFLDKFKIKIETALKSDNNNTIVNKRDINNIFNDLQNNNLSLGKRLIYIMNGKNII